MRRVLRTLAVLTLAATAACGTDRAQAVLDQTESNLAKIHSGDLRMHMAASAGAEGDERPVGFEVAGAFSAPTRAGELPVARLRRTRLVGGPLEPTTFVSTGQRAYLEVAGDAYELPEAQVQSLRASRAPAAGGAGLQRLGVAEWARDPKLADAGHLVGVAVQRVTGEADVVRALNDIVTVANQLASSPGEGLGPVDARSAEQVERAVRSSRLEVVTGKEDRLLRRLRLDVTLAAAEVRGLEAALGPLAGSRLRFEIDLSGFNRKVEVQAPPSPRPLQQAPSAKG